MANIKYICLLILGLTIFSLHSDLYANEYDFTFVHINYNGRWNQYPGFEDTIINSVRKYTSININPKKKVMRLTDKELFNYPFIYMSGCKRFPILSKNEVSILRDYLINGGLLFVDNCAGKAGLNFDKGFREEMKKIFPEKKVNALKKDHAVYKTFFLLKNIGGRRLAKPYIEGITLGDWTPVLYTQNDFAGAWTKNKFGIHKFSCEPGGERQRNMSIRSGINIILYSLTVNYKKDQVHIPFILKRRK